MSMENLKRLLNEQNIKEEDAVKYMQEFIKKRSDDAKAKEEEAKKLEEAKKVEPPKQDAKKDEPKKEETKKEEHITKDEIVKLINDTVVENISKVLKSTRKDSPVPTDPKDKVPISRNGANYENVF